MDIATIVGIFAAFGLIAGIMHEAGGIGNYMNMHGAAVVFGGTLGAILIAFPMSDVLGLIKVIKNAFFAKLHSVDATIAQLVDFASRARRDGILALEAASKEIHDQFLKRGIQLAVDGQEPDAIETILQTEIDTVKARHKKGSEILAMGATLAPALGLIGTLIGLVQMFNSMSDPSGIGPAMATALLATFYGAVTANLLCNPMANKLRRRSEEEIEVRELTVQGILAIASGDNPRVVEQRLHAFLKPAHRKSAFS